MLEKITPYHRGGGCPEGGQFCSADEDGVGGEGSVFGAGSISDSFAQAFQDAFGSNAVGIRF